jgi:hypothetical protein
MRREHYRHVAGGLIFGNPHPSLTNRGRLTVMALRTRSAGSLPEGKAFAKFLVIVFWPIVQEFELAPPSTIRGRLSRRCAASA